MSEYPPSRILPVLVVTAKSMVAVWIGLPPDTRATVVVEV